MFNSCEWLLLGTFESWIQELNTRYEYVSDLVQHQTGKGLRHASGPVLSPLHPLHKYNISVFDLFVVSTTKHKATVMINHNFGLKYFATIEQCGWNFQLPTWTINLRVIFYCFIVSWIFFIFFELQKIVKRTIFSYTHPICLEFAVVFRTFYLWLN